MNMKRNRIKKFSQILVFTLAVTCLVAGCGQSDSESGRNTSSSAAGSRNSSVSNDDGGNAQGAAELEVCFGDKGEPFVLHLYDNDTAAAIARHVGTADWRLPIYHYDDYDDWKVMQYYDIPSRYDIPSNPETVTEEKAGEVYYSEPNRILLFYQDAEVTGEYTKVGYFDYTEELKSAVEDNPVLEGWGNKIVLINSMN